jgi:hypothetical protein
MKLFTNLWAQLASVAVVFVGALIDPIVGIIAFIFYFLLWAFNYTKSQ